MAQINLHSSDVSIYLQANGSRIDVAACLGNSCTVRTPVELNPCYADLVIIVDGQERRKRVYLEKGISKESKEVHFSHTVTGV